jgi:hypothetical protein
MSQPQPYPQVFAQPTPGAQPYPLASQPFPQSRHVAGQWAAPAGSRGRCSAHYGGGSPQLFQVRVTKHTGLLVAYYNQSYTITGTWDQCEAAIRAAQQHNLLAGWWSMFSLLIMNWVALAENHNARNALRRQVTQAFAGYPYGGWVLAARSAASAPRLV